MCRWDAAICRLMWKEDDRGRPDANTDGKSYGYSWNAKAVGHERRNALFMNPSGCMQYIETMCKCTSQLKPIPQWPNEWFRALAVFFQIFEERSGDAEFRDFAFDTQMSLQVFDIFGWFIHKSKAAPTFVPENAKEWQDSESCWSVFHVEEVRQRHDVVFCLLINLAKRCEVVVI